MPSTIDVEHSEAILRRDRRSRVRARVNDVREGRAGGARTSARRLAWSVTARMRPPDAALSRRTRSGLRVSTTADAPRSSRAFAQSRVSSSQQPRKPVPPVRKTRAPRSSCQTSPACSSARSRSFARGLAVVTPMFSTAPCRRPTAIPGSADRGACPCTARTSRGDTRTAGRPPPAPPSARAPT